jgi:hypothetical protein
VLVDAAEAKDSLVQLVLMQLQRVWDLLGETWPNYRLLGTKQICVKFPRLLYLVRLMSLHVLLLLDLFQ